MHYRGKNKLHERSSHTEREREIRKKMELTRGTAVTEETKARNSNDV